MQKITTVLFLSEDQKAGELIMRALKDKRCDLVQRGHAEPATTALKEREFDAIIVDLEQYRPDPFLEIREARAHDDALDIIAMGSAHDAKKMVDALKAGADEYLWKPLNTEQAALILTRLQDRRKLKELAREAELYRKLANTDELTGLYNYRYFHQRLDAEFARSSRLQSNLCLLLLDIDNFKEYNDLHGHLAGDEVLKQIAALLIRHSRIYDSAARYGGEEFAVIAPGSLKAAAKVLGLRLKDKIEKFDFKGEKQLSRRKLTISIGIASFPDDASDKTELLNRADQALYTAKKLGKNRVVIWDDENP